MTRPPRSTTPPGPAPSQQTGLVFHVPPQLVLLGSALAPVAEGLQRELRRRVRSSGRVFEVPEDLTRHLGLLETALSHLEPRPGDLMKSVINNEHATAIDAGRAAGRLEQVLSEFTEAYFDVRLTCTGPTHPQARELLLGIYRHFLTQISHWLNRVVRAIEQPQAEISQQGLDAHDGMVLSVNLNLTTPVQMQALRDLIQRLVPLAEEPQHASTMAPDRPPSLLEKASALAFALGFVSAVRG